MAEEQPKYEREKVIKIINSVLSKAERGGDGTGPILAELKDLQRIILEARSEIGATRADEISGKHIPTATDELDAVVQATAEATGNIMDACETIDEIAQGIADQDKGQAISAEVVKVFEACSFQDITGQRITKVVTTLKTIEGKVNALVGALGDTFPSGTGTGTGGEEDTRTGDARLLNGPQMPDKAITQDDIDRLLNED